jgi:ferredoxin-nitrite reductase
MQGAMQSQLWRGQVGGAALHFRVQTTGNQDAARVGPANGRNCSARASAEREVKASAVAAAPPIAENRLVPRVEERDGYWVVKEEFRQGINPTEKIKLQKEPMKFFVENEVEQLAKIPFAELDTSKPGKDDIDVRLKWLGLFHRRKHQCEY